MAPTAPPIDFNDIYQSQVRPQVEEGNHGKIVAINIETGVFEVAKEVLRYLVWFDGGA